MILSAAVLRFAADREVSWYWLHGFEKAKKPRGLSFGSMMRKLEDELGL